jgi:hypothetical protein
MKREDAALDMPFKLVISVVILTMATAILLPVLHAYQQSEVEHRMEVVVAEISSAARAVFNHPGSAKTVLVNIPPAGPVHMERLVIGGDLSGHPAEAATIRWSHSSGASGSMVVRSVTGPVPLANQEGKALVITGSICLLVLEEMESPQGSWSKRFVQVLVV